MAARRGKGKLIFIGLGLRDEHGVSLEGFERIKRADVVFAEAYTSMLSEGSLDRLKKMTGKEIVLLDRIAVEDGRNILDACEGRTVALLIAGDPMSATTHVDLRLRAIQKGLETEIVHGSSILTAVPGILGLQHYKFGRTTTIPFPQEGYSPTSPYDVIAENLSRGLHTLMLLDIDAENSRYMTANEAMHLLQDMERRVGRGVISDNTLVCVVARAGAPDCLAKAGRLAELVHVDFGGPLHAIVIPGRLHFLEEEALRIVAGA